MQDCIFCKIVAGEVPCSKIQEDEDFFVFNDIAPQTPVHILIVPKKHIKDLQEASEVDAELLGKLQLLAPKLAEKFNIVAGYQLLLNAGRFQEVPHLHYHLKGGMK